MEKLNIYALLFHLCCYMLNAIADKDSIVVRVWQVGGYQVWKPTDKIDVALYCLTKVYLVVP